jgi:hypothetical protein
MAAKPAYKRLIGRRIVAIEQKWFPNEAAREGRWGVTALLLDDDARIVLETQEHEDFYSVRLIRVPKEVSDD